MKRSRGIALGVLASLSLALVTATALAHPDDSGPAMMQPGMGMGGGGMRGPMAAMTGSRTGQDGAFAADMGLVHEMIVGHERIKRSVTNLPDGIRTVTESDDPKVAQAIIAHVASMSQRLTDGREFNLFSPTISVLFRNKDKIKTVIEHTKTGSIVTQTSGDAAVVAALQVHAGEVSELARDGMLAMRRSAQAGMARGAPMQR